MNNKKLTKVAVIPARGGSTRLKDKNIRLLGGKPLIRWAVENVINSKQFDTIIVSTDSDKIFNAIKDLPVIRHVRPKEFATTKITVLKAMIDLMENYLDKKYDIFSYFLPTSPFVSEKYIIEGLEMIKEIGVDSVIAVHEYESPIQLACIRKNNDLIPIFDNLTSGLTNSKFIQKYYKPSGSFYISRWDYLLKNKNFFKGNVKSVLIPNKLLVDIDYKEDLEYAEYLYQNHIKKNKNTI
jgi:CMP-N-acetylneuraminic acid synthetase